MQNILEIYTDGGARGNPGPAGIGVYATLNGEVILDYSGYIGEETNNVAEYHAFLKSIDLLLEMKDHNQMSQVVWFLDSKLVVEQLNKNWKIKRDHLKILATQAWEKLAQLTLPYKIQYIPREKNKQADLRVNLAQDQHSS